MQWINFISIKPLPGEIRYMDPGDAIKLYNDYANERDERIDHSSLVPLVYITKKNNLITFISIKNGVWSSINSSNVMELNSIHKLLSDSGYNLIYEDMLEVCGFKERDEEAI